VNPYDQAPAALGSDVPYGWAEPPPPPGRQWRRSLTVAALCAVVLAIAGGPLGLLWHYVAPTVPVINTGQNGIVVGDASPEEYIAADGWFALLGFGFGLLAGVAAWMLLRRHRGPWLIGGVAAGALAAAVVAWQAGRLIGRGAYQQWVETSAASQTYQAPPDVHAYGTLLVPAFAAAIVLTLMAGWSNDPDLDRPGTQPGYGHEPQTPGAVSSDWPGAPDPTAAPVPPGPGPGDLPRG
jgi:hypothetical protein